jgi:uncharacterized protein YajQ (UPF0234 family)
MPTPYVSNNSVQKLTKKRAANIQTLIKAKQENNARITANLGHRVPAAQDALKSEQTRNLLRNIAEKLKKINTTAITKKSAANYLNMKEKFNANLTKKIAKLNNDEKKRKQKNINNRKITVAASGIGQKSTEENHYLNPAVGGKRRTRRRHHRTRKH